MACHKCHAELPDGSEFCLKCGAKVAAQPAVQSDSAPPATPIEMGESASPNPKDSLVGVGGWLAFFLLTMMLFSPLMDILYLGEHPNEIHNPFVLLVILTVHGLGYYAGILMLRGKAKGIRWAKIRLMVGAGIGVLGVVGGIVGGLADPNDTATSSGVMSGLRAIGYAAIWLAYLGQSERVKNTYPSIPEPSKAEPIHRKPLTFILWGGALICVVLVIGYLGIRAKHYGRIKTLTKQSAIFGKKGAAAKQHYIQAVQRETPTMPEYIQRCADLEVALNEYEPLLHDGDVLFSQILDELQYVKSDAEYAKLISPFTVFQAVLRKDMESARAFRREVDYAKQLSVLATPDDRTRFYKANIVPAKDDEERIANEEIAILKDAKARGVNLPESLYREVGLQ